MTCAKAWRVQSLITTIFEANLASNSTEKISTMKEVSRFGKYGLFKHYSGDSLRKAIPQRLAGLP